MDIKITIYAKDGTEAAHAFKILKKHSIDIQDYTRKSWIKKAKEIV